jgi:hypothetical protein
VGNGLPATEEYHSVAWYQLQLLLNDGNGRYTIDWPYAMAYFTVNFTWNQYSNPTGPRVGTAGFLTEWLVKALQNDMWNDAQSPGQYVLFPSQVSWPIDISASEKVQIMNDYLAAWLGKFGAMNSSQFQAWIAIGSSFNNDPTQTTFGTDLINALPQLRYQGVSTTLLNQVTGWAATIWPSYNWTQDLNKSCSAGNLGQIFCN